MFFVDVFCRMRLRSIEKFHRIIAGQWIEPALIFICRRVDMRHPGSTVYCSLCVTEKSFGIFDSHAHIIRSYPGIWRLRRCSQRQYFFRMYVGAGVISPDKNLIWEFKCPEGTETHSCQPIGKDRRVNRTQRQSGLKWWSLNTAENKILKEIIIPTTTTSTHVQFRHVRNHSQRHDLSSADGGK